MYIMYVLNPLHAVSYGTTHVESQLLGRPTIRHRNCERIVEGGVQCISCKGHRDALHSIYYRMEKGKKSMNNNTSSSSHVNYIHLSSPEKKLRLATRVYSSGGGGGEASPPNMSASPPRERVLTKSGIC